MKRICLLIVIFIAITVQAQQSTFIYFEDKNGLRDSLEIALGLTDEQIAEIPLLTPEEAIQAFKDSTSFVLIKTKSLWEERMYSHIYEYIPYKGLVEYDKRTLLIPADRLPVTITWDRQFFIDNELANSVMSDAISWFDAVCRDGELYKLLLAHSDSCIIHDTNTGDQCSYIYAGDMLVKMIGIALGTIQNPLEGISKILDTPSASKILRDGQLFILRNNKTYTLQGQQVE